MTDLVVKKELANGLFRMWELLSRFGLYLLDLAFGLLVTKISVVTFMDEPTCLIRCATNLLNIYSGMSQLVGRLTRLHHLLSYGT